MIVLNKYKISVIIPFYNAEEFISKTLYSIVTQSYKNIEVILIDDGSTDSSADIISQYIKKHEYIHTFKNSDKGAGSARNIGLKQSTGDYIVFVDADDYLSNGSVFEKLIIAAQQTEADIIMGNYMRLWNERLLPVEASEPLESLNQQTEDFYFKGFFSCGGLSYVWGKLYRRSFLEKNRIYFENIEYAEDKLFNMQCYICHAKYAFVKDFIYVYRKNNESISWQYHPNSPNNWLNIAYLTESWINNHNENMTFYRGLIQYTILFASFFDGKMEYKEHHQSMKAIKEVLKVYENDPLGKEIFINMACIKRLCPLTQTLWKAMIWTFSFGMKHHLYSLLAIGIKLLVDLRIDERLSDTGLREDSLIQKER